MQNPRLILLVIAVLVLAGLACNISQQGQANQPGSQAAPPGAAQDNPPGDKPFAQAATAIPSEPLGLREGLASLNSYRLHMLMDLSGPTPSDVSRTTSITAYSQAGDALHIHMESFSSSSESPEPEQSAFDQYLVGNVSCSVDDDPEQAGELSEITPLQDEMTTALWGLTDMTVRVEKPVFVGAETINGVQANHFTFQLSGLGATSGGEVTHSEGEYWLAVDGQYLVKYQVLLEVRTAPQGDAGAEVMRTEFKIELTDINQPIAISLPAACQ